MSKRPVNIDFNVVSTVVKGLKSQAKNMLNWIDELEKILEKGNYEAHGKHIYKRKRDRASSDPDGGAWPT